MSRSILFKFKILIVLSAIFPLVLNAQSKPVTNKSDLEKIYVQAISDFMKAAELKNAKAFDTLFVNKRKQNEDDDFPEITLPNSIVKTAIVLDNFDAHLDVYRKLKHRINLNLIGWVYNDKAEFMCVVFSNGFDHQYDYNLKYNFNKKTKKYEMTSIKYIDQPVAQKN